MTYKIWKAVNKLSSFPIYSNPTLRNRKKHTFGTVCSFVHEKATAEGIRIVRSRKMGRKALRDDVCPMADADLEGYLDSER